MPLPRRRPVDALASAGDMRHAVPGFDEPLRFFNGHGGFSADGSEYVIRLAPGDAGPVRPPLPWANVPANERVGFIATESGAMYTWSANSRENRLTPWLNDPVTDPHGEALYLRDEESGACWSPTPGPTPGPGAYEARHGMGYTRWRTTAHDLESEVLAFVPRLDPVKIVRLRVTNRGATARRVAAFSYAQLVLGVFPWETGPSVETRAEDGVILAVNPKNGEFAPLVAFAAVCGGADASLTADRAEFLGALGGADRPAAVWADRLSGRVGKGLDPCAAFRVALDLAPGETGEVVFLLGQGNDAAEARTVAARYREPSAVEAALDLVRAFWRDTVGGVQVETPSPALDLMVNGWLTYQNLSCRVWGRSAYYQSGGAFGFRDQLQDTAALVHLAPELTRRQIVLHAAHQFVEGDVLHWWHPPTSKGMRTRFADDLLWLPYVAAYYVRTTGDTSVLDEDARFVTAHQLAPGEDEEFLLPRDSGTSASVYDHCCRSLDRSLTAGAHGLPLMGVGDWNDGMNRVGREGRGESVWLGFFLSAILDDFIPLCEWRGDRERAERYGEYAQRLRQSLNADGEGWDGGWYRRAYYDDGTPLGASTNDECRIDTIAQAWAVISRVAPPEKAEQALDAMERHLVSEGEGIIRLLTPAFDKTPHDPGYIKGYLPGVRENGGQYTHGALWAVKALAELGRTERAARLLEMLSPVTRGATADAIGVYQVEPYVIAADVYGVAPHVGRGGWTWYTGSAGWMFRVALESILGVELVGGDTLVVRPCIPREWPGFTVRYRLADRATTYELLVTRGEGATTARGDGTGEGPSVDGGAVRIPVRRDGGTHRVEIALGGDVGPRYAAR
jgi:cyclic beta-1,2-glucan synthetase